MATTIPSGVKIVIDGGSWDVDTTGGALEQKNNGVITGTMTNVDLDITDDDYTIASGDTLNCVGGSLGFNDLNVAGTLTTSNGCDVDGDNIETTGMADLICGACNGEDWHVTGLALTEGSSIDTLDVDNGLTLDASLIVDTLDVGAGITMSGTDTFLTVKTSIDCDSIMGSGYLAFGSSVDTSDTDIVGEFITTVYGANISVDMTNRIDGSTAVITRGDTSKPYLLERKYGDNWVVINDHCDSSSIEINNNNSVYRVFDGNGFIYCVAHGVPRITGLIAPVAIYAQIENADTDYLIKRSEVSSIALTVKKWVNSAWSTVTGYDGISVDTSCFGTDQMSFDLDRLPTDYNFGYDFSEEFDEGDYKATFTATLTDGETVEFSCLFSV